ncbi:tetratricopeptide repeat protein [Porticoccus sp.]
MNKPCYTLPVLVLCTALLFGCAHPQPSSAGSAADLTANAAIAHQDAEPSVEPPAAREYPVRPIPAETLYDLMVAELAGMQNDLNLALNNYLIQARATRDPGIVARAARIAAYTENHPALLEISLLWTGIEPNNLDARSVATLSLAREGRLTEALRHAEYSLDQGDQEPIMSLAVASGGANREQRQALLAEYPQLLQRLPGNEAVLLTQAMLLRQQGEFIASLSTVETLLERAPRKESAIMLKAQLLHQLDRKKDATEFLGVALEDIADSRRLRLQYARFLAEDDLEAAYQQLSILMEQYPRDSELAYTLALVCKGLDRNEEAKQLFRELSMNPNMASSAHFELGVLAEEEGDSEAVLLHYRQVRNGPKLLPAAVRFSKFMAHHDQLDSAQLYLSKLRLDHPQYSASLYQIESELLVEMQQLRDAHHLLSEALLQFPDNISLLYSRSLLSERQNDFASSEQDLRAILDQDANNSMALNALGYTLTVHTDRYEEAHQLILRALELNPGDPAIIDSLGWVLYQQGDYEAAIRHLRDALTKLPDPEIAAHLGEALWVNGQRQEASEVWQAILDRDPHNPAILQTMERLEAN